MLAIVTDHWTWSGVDVLVQRFAGFLRAKSVPFCLVADGPSRLQVETPWAPVITTGELSHRCRNGFISAIYFPTASMLRRQDLPWRSLGNIPVFTLLVQPYEPVTRYVPALTLLIERIGFAAVDIVRAIIPGHLRQVGTLFRDLAARGALGVMDGASNRALRHFFPGIADAQLLPIPAPVAERPAWERSHDPGVVSFGYLGRMDPLKWSALQPVIVHELSVLARSTTVELHAVAEGPCMAQLRAACDRAGIKLFAHGYLPNASARELLARRTSIGLAMGTSALDLAGSGLPCIIIDPAARLKARRQRFFHFMHEARDHTLGEYRDFAAYEQHGRMFADCVAMAADPARGAADYAYVRSRHDPDTIFEATLRAIQQSRLTGEILAAHVEAIESSFSRMGRWYRWAGTDGRFRFPRRARSNSGAP